MKPGRASRTAVLVCMGRAAAHGATPTRAFDDPTAIELLPDDARARVERFRASAAHRNPETPATWIRARLDRAYLTRQSSVMVVRTIAIDDAVREAACPQLVILGAGLDGRAWRMSELADTVVFEVDHPDSQRDKRSRVPRLEQRAREVRYVSVDFTRDSLEEALAAAGHDAASPTTWVWEGVVMYLTPRDIDATLRVLARRSATGSRLVVTYHRPALTLFVFAPVVGALGEPFRSTYSATRMRALLERHGLDVVRDEDFTTLAARLAPEVGRASSFAKHLRIVTADARSSSGNHAETSR